MIFNYIIFDIFDIFDIFYIISAKLNFLIKEQFDMEFSAAKSVKFS